MKLGGAALEDSDSDLDLALAQDVLLLCLNTQGMLLAQGKGRTQVQTHQALPPQKVVW